MKGTSHPTVHGPEQGLSVLSRFAKDFRRPTAYEGFDCIFSLIPSDTSLNYSSSEITTILQRVRASPVPTSTSWVNRRGHSRPSERRSQRGGGRGGHSINTSEHIDTKEEQVSFWRRLGEKAGAILPQEDSPRLDAKVASKAIGNDDRHHVDEQGTSQAVEQSRNLLDSLGVD